MCCVLNLEMNTYFTVVGVGSHFLATNIDVRLTHFINIFFIYSVTEATSQKD